MHGNRSKENPVAAGCELRSNASDRMATGVDIDKHLFNSLHRLIALIEPGAGSNFERPLL